MRRAFTLVELLVVIVVLGILLAIMLPSIQAAREAARRAHCANNHKQVALAVLNHVSAHGRLPGLCNSGFNRDAYGFVSWRFTILPYLEEGALSDEISQSGPWQTVSGIRDEAGRRSAFVSVYQCPSNGRYPEFVNRHMVHEASGQVLFGKLGTAHNRANYEFTSITDIGRVHVGPWYGTSRRWPEQLRQSEADLTFYRGAKLQYTTDGLSQTILRGEYVSMCDGAARFLSEDTSVEVIRALLTRAEGDRADAR